jgi:hypothetical protein
MHASIRDGLPPDYAPATDNASNGAHHAALPSNGRTPPRASTHVNSGKYRDAMHELSLGDDIPDDASLFR